MDLGGDRRGRGMGFRQDSGARLERLQNRAPGGFGGTLEMQRLDANERQPIATRQEALGARARGEADVLFEDAADPAFLFPVQVVKAHELAVEQVAGFRAKEVGEASGHAGAEIQAERPKDQSNATGHVFAAMLANAFDDGESAAVANGETLTGAASDIELAGSGAIEHGVADKNVAPARSGRARG